MSKPRPKEVKKCTQVHTAEKLLNLTFWFHDPWSFPFTLGLLRLSWWDMRPKQPSRPEAALRSLVSAPHSTNLHISTHFPQNQSKSLTSRQKSCVSPPALVWSLPANHAAVPTYTSPKCTWSPNETRTLCTNFKEFSLPTMTEGHERST